MINIPTNSLKEFAHAEVIINRFSDHIVSTEYRDHTHRGPMRNLDVDAVNPEYIVSRGIAWVIRNLKSKIREAVQLDKFIIGSNVTMRFQVYSRQDRSIIFWRAGEEFMEMLKNGYGLKVVSMVENPPGMVKHRIPDERELINDTIEYWYFDITFEF